MKYSYFLPVLLAAATMPAAAQEQPRQEPGNRTHQMPRIFDVMRSPRAVLGISTSVGAGLADTAGVLVEDVLAGGPAERVGIAKGARLTEIDGITLKMSPADAEDPMLSRIGSRRLTRELGEKKPGDEVRLGVVTNGRARTVTVRLADRDSVAPRRVEAPRARVREIRRERLADRASLGVQVGATGSPRDTLGVFVMGVDDKGPAARAGVIEGNRIAAIDGVDLRVSRADAADPAVAGAKVRQLMRALGEKKPGDEVELRVWQNGQYRNVRVRAVAADSLGRDRRTMIIGDGSGPGRIFLEGGAGFPFGADSEGFSMRLGPGFHEELELMLDEALREAGRALESAPRTSRRSERVH